MNNKNQDNPIQDLENAEQDAEISFSYDRDEPAEESTDDALTYLSGWVARKFKVKHPYMEDKLKKENGNPATNNKSWLLHLSYGGLTNPSSTWLTQARKLNEEFKTFHGSQIYKGPGKYCVFLNVLTAQTK